MNETNENQKKKKNKKKSKRKENRSSTGSSWIRDALLDSYSYRVFMVPGSSNRNRGKTPRARGKDRKRKTVLAGPKRRSIDLKNGQLRWEKDRRTQREAV